MRQLTVESSVELGFQEFERNMSCGVGSETPGGAQVMPRPTIFTQAALARVVGLVDHGHSAAQIADEIGCTLGTLRVRCSQHGISLRRRGTGSREETLAAMDLVPPLEARAPHDANLLTESIQSTKVGQLLVNHQLTSALNSKFCCRKVSRSSSGSAVRCGGFPAQLWPPN